MPQPRVRDLLTRTQVQAGELREKGDVLQPRVRVSPVFQVQAGEPQSQACGTAPSTGIHMREDKAEDLWRKVADACAVRVCCSSMQMMDNVIAGS